MISRAIADNGLPLKPRLAESELHWKRKTDFKGLVRKMYKHDERKYFNK